MSPDILVILECSGSDLNPGGDFRRVIGRYGERQMLRWTLISARSALDQQLERLDASLSSVTNPEAAIIMPMLPCALDLS